ncbi:4 [Durusdinium trenchii]|uniref:4 n=1 Tax=Durusdinium trenchii TaxID=1381693 RepID=A0ABP0PRR8_9DINO
MKVTKQGNELIWPYDLPAIRPAANNQEELQCCTLVMVLYSKGTKLGSIGLRFPGWSPSHALDAERFQYRFEKPLVLKSSTFGTGALSGTLEVNWNELGIAAENQLAAAARPKPVRPDKCCVVQ